MLLVKGVGTLKSEAYRNLLKSGQIKSPLMDAGGKLRGQIEAFTGAAALDRRCRCGAMVLFLLTALLHTEGEGAKERSRG